MQRSVRIVSTLEEVGHYRVSTFGYVARHDVISNLSQRLVSSIAPMAA